MNALLADPDQVNVASLLPTAGSVCSWSPSSPAAHGIHVRLQTNIYGGVQGRTSSSRRRLLGTAPGAPGAPEGTGTAGGGQPLAPPQQAPRPRAAAQGADRGRVAAPSGRGTIGVARHGGAGTSAGPGTRAAAD